MVNLFKNLRPSKITILKYNGKSIFFLKLFIVDQKALEKNSFVIMYTFESNLLSELILDLGKCLTRKRMKVKVQVFFFGHFSGSKISFESRFN